jgi:UDP-2-acetamido-2,6-beta-L-arabino-hexul-4-ose reductase
MTRRIVVLGAGGFIGKTLMLRAAETQGLSAERFGREATVESLAAACVDAHCIINLAGVNRVHSEAELLPGTVAPVQMIFAALKISGSKPEILHVSSSRSGDGSAYGAAKLAVEQLVEKEARTLGLRASIFRPPNVFGKWCRPNYNSAVATFCHNIARGLPITIHDGSAPLKLVYVDDLVDALLRQALTGADQEAADALAPFYNTTVGEVASTLQDFQNTRQQGHVANVGTGLMRALYATYVSGLPGEEFSYPLVSHRDPRGAFSEMLKTPAAGQFSYFSANPGVTRGGHYHHSKVEKFLIVHGKARFRFRHVLTQETREIFTSADVPTVVETIPGWAHDVTNVGDDIMVSLLWANEIFNRDKPDTIAAVL